MKKWTLSKKGLNWQSIPFSLYFGWLTVATIANITILLTSLGWSGGPASPFSWTIILLTITLIFGIAISLIYKDIVYPLVIIWALIAIYIARNPEEQLIASTALIFSLILFVWIIGYGIRIFKKAPHGKKLQHS